MQSTQFSLLARNFAKSYKTYIKYSASTGAVFGTATSIALMYDMDRKFYATEKLLYPLVGAIGGSFVFVSAPVWVVFAPMTYLFGHETAGKFANLGLLAILGTHDDSSQEEKE